VITCEPAVNKGKGVGSSRKLGKLAQLMNMPLDVFFEARLFFFRPEVLQTDLYHCRLPDISSLSIFSVFHVFPNSFA
jgi:hypothetical protein